MSKAIHWAGVEEVMTVLQTAGNFQRHDLALDDASKLDGGQFSFSPQRKWRPSDGLFPRDILLRMPGPTGTLAAIKVHATDSSKTSFWRAPGLAAEYASRPDTGVVFLQVTTTLDPIGLLSRYPGTEKFLRERARSGGGEAYLMRLHDLLSGEFLTMVATGRHFSG